MPVPHFGAALTVDAFHALAERLKVGVEERGGRWWGALGYWLRLWAPAEGEEDFLSSVGGTGRERAGRLGWTDARLQVTRNERASHALADGRDGATGIWGSRGLVPGKVAVSGVGIE